MTGNRSHTNTTAIWKFPLSDRRSIEMPAGAEVIRLAKQGGVPTLWARVNPSAPNKARLFQVFGTGHPIEPGAKYVGTFDDGPFVWHVFELLSDEQEK